jgi:peptidoglycan/xylan/chitin deacetylase (PgdA/CDA1 family)
MGADKKIIFTMDVEHDIQNAYSMDSARTIIPKVIDVLKGNNIIGDFFLSTDALIDHSNIGLLLYENGHSVGNHNLIHDYLRNFTYKGQYEQLDISTKIFRNIIGVHPKIFRAPNFSIDHNTIMILDRLGYEIDSSVFPGWRIRNKILLRRHVFPNALKEPYHPSDNNFLQRGGMKILEAPVSKNPLCSNCPIGGGGLAKYGVDEMVRVVDDSRDDVVILLFHPWELLPNHILNTDGISIMKKFEEFIERLSNKYSFIRSIDLNDRI